MDRKTERLFLDERISMPGDVNSFVIRLKGKVIGQITICKNKEISYEIFREYEGNGYATEALREVMKIAFENSREPILIIYKDNAASQRVAKKTGFYIKSSHGEWDEWIATKEPE